MDTTNNNTVVAVTGHGYRRPVLTQTEGQSPSVEAPESMPSFGNRATVVHYDENVGKPLEDSPATPINFDGKDFKDTQMVLNAKARADMLRRQAEEVRAERTNLANGQFRRANDKADDECIGEPIGESIKAPADDVIQAHLDKFKTAKDLESYLHGNVKNQKVADRINEFFMDEDGDELLLNTNGTTIKTQEQELDFKRSLLIYFKQNDEYLKNIDDELAKLNDEVAEFNSEISSALNPLKDNILAYVSYLEEQGTPDPADDVKATAHKRDLRKKAKMIRSGYTLENLIELVEKTPSIIQNSLKDFRNESRIKDIGERYGKKLKTSNISITLFNLLSNDIKDSVEYRIFAPGEYPEGLEGFTIFFIIRSLSVTLPDKHEETFHAAVQVAFSALLNGDLDPDVEKSMKESIKKFLSYFA